MQHHPALTTTEGRKERVMRAQPDQNGADKKGRKKQRGRSSIPAVHSDLLTFPSAFIQKNLWHICGPNTLQNNVGVFLQLLSCFCTLHKNRTAASLPLLSLHAVTHTAVHFSTGRGRKDFLSDFKTCAQFSCILRRRRRRKKKKFAGICFQK